MAWLGTLTAAVMAGVTLFWHDDLADAAGARLWAEYAAFMAATFVFHAGLAMCAVVIFALLTRRPRLALLGLIVGLLAAGPELLTIARRASPSTPTSPTVTVMSINLMYGAGDPAVVLAEIHRIGADVVVFQEWTPGASAKLGSLLRDEFSHVAEVPRDDAFGQAVFSRREFLSPPRLYPPVAGFREPEIAVELELAGKPVRIADVHVLPPINPSVFAEQRRMIRALAGWASTKDGSAPHVFAGDFNGVTRSSVVRVFTDAGLVESHDEASGDGSMRASSWPRTGLLARVPGVRLDHVLHSAALECFEAGVCGDTGSDHAPVYARLRWAAP